MIAVNVLLTMVAMVVIPMVWLSEYTTGLFAGGITVALGGALYAIWTASLAMRQLDKKLSQTQHKE